MRFIEEGLADLITIAIGKKREKKNDEEKITLEDNILSPHGNMRHCNNPVDKGSKLNVHKTSYVRSVHVLCLRGTAV